MSKGTGLLGLVPQVVVAAGAFGVLGHGGARCVSLIAPVLVTSSKLQHRQQPQPISGPPRLAVCTHPVGLDNPNGAHSERPPNGVYDDRGPHPRHVSEISMHTLVSLFAATNADLPGRSVVLARSDSVYGSSVRCSLRSLHRSSLIFLRSGSSEPEPSHTTATAQKTNSARCQTSDPSNGWR